jgi:hypothetical protein
MRRTRPPMDISAYSAREILRGHTNATIRCSHAHRARLVAAVDFVSTVTKAESHFEASDKIVRVLLSRMDCVRSQDGSSNIAMM